MLMLLCEGTLTRPRTAEQSEAQSFSTRAESKRMKQENGGCVRRTQTKNR